MPIDKLDRALEFRHLRCFVAVAEERHFGRAAERLGMTQPPLSVAIQQLERRVGARLFERDSKGVRLTPACASFRLSAQTLLSVAEQACARAREVQAGELGRGQQGRGHVCVTRGGEGQRRLLGGAVEVVVVELNSQDQIDALLREELDLALLHTNQLPPGLDSRPLYAEPFLACLPASHPQARKKLVPLATLADQPFILFSRKGSPDYHARIVEICRQHGFYPRLQHEGRHWLSVVSLVAQGLGVSIVPAAFQRAGIQGAVFRPLAETLEASAVFAAWRRDGDSALRTRFLAARPQ